MKPSKSPSQKLCILVEGETERRYLLAYYRAVVVRKINLWEHNSDRLKDKLGDLPATTQILVIADTDVLDNSDRFVRNIRQLSKVFTKTPIVLLQNKVFEEELAFSCNCSENHLFNHFQASSASQFKSNFNCESRLPVKLSQLNHQPRRMWVRSRCCVLDLSAISMIANVVFDASDLTALFVGK